MRGSSNIVATHPKHAHLAPVVGIYGNAASHDPEAATSSCRCPQQIHFWFELIITVLVEQGNGLLSSKPDGEMTINPDKERVP
jgi:hypothetical protein